MVVVRCAFSSVMCMIVEDFPDSFIGGMDI